VCEAFDPVDGRGEHHARFQFTCAPVPGLSPLSDNALVKLDIEGDEWPWLESSDLTKIAMLVVELHSPHLGRWSWPMLAKLAASHVLVWAHGNNWDGIVDIDGVRVPGTLETCWVRRDFVEVATPNAQPIPGPLDFPNRPELPDHVLASPPFVVMGS
jgi:hypothetical protein